MRVISSFLGNSRAVVGLKTHEELIELLILSSRNKYDSFKHVFEPVRLSYSTRRARIETAVDFTISTSIDRVDGEYRINILVNEITGTVRKMSSDGTGKVLFKVTANSDFEQNVDSILKRKEMICDQIAAYVDDPSIKEFYYKEGTGLPIEHWLVYKYRRIVNGFKIKSAEYGSTTLSLFDAGLVKALKMF